MWQSFLQALTRLVIPEALDEISQPPDNLRDFMFFYLWPLRRLIFCTLLIAGIATVTELLLYVFLGQVLDWIQNDPGKNILAEHGWTMLGMFLVAALLRPASMILSRGIITFAITVGLGNTIRWHNFRYVIRQSLAYFQEDFAGRVAQKVMQTGNSAREALLNIIDGLWLLLIYLVGSIWLFVGMDWQLIIPIVLWMVGYISVVRLQVPQVRQKSATLSEANSQWLGQVVDSFSNIQSVKLFADAQQEDAHMLQYLRRHSQAFFTLMGGILGMTANLVLLNTGLIILTAWIALTLWQQGEISSGAIAVAMAVVLRINQMSGWILRTITSFFEHLGTVQNGIETISKPPGVLDVGDAKDLILTAGKIAFENVSFSYSPQLAVIDNLNLVIESGEKVGLVGRSGAGKTTLVNLLARFYDVNAGRICIDEQSIAEVTQESLRRQIAMVTQDTALLHRSVADNILYGKPEATQAELQQAAKLAGLDQFVHELTDSYGNKGFNALVGERGVKLSGGQRQRIAIARVLLKDAPILILDEATSALDSEIEAVIQERLGDLMRDKTVIAIAHRLSTLTSMDRLIVLDQGKIVEIGKHQELLALKGIYAQLWKHQTQFSQRLNLSG